MSAQLRNGGRLALLLACSIAPLACTGCTCRQSPAPPAAANTAATASAPAIAPASAAEAPILLAEASTWSREEAVEKLGDEAARLSAAVRLVQLAGIGALCVPEPITNRTARRLHVAALSARLWALGFVVEGDEAKLAAPVLIDYRGEVVQPARGVEEELLVLCISEDAEIFPHLLISPRRVQIAAVPLVTAIVLREDPLPLCFQLRFQDKFPYVALLLDGDDRYREATRYVWDPYELMFTGPGCDKLPDPPGGKFRIDLRGSQKLNPVGGEIPDSDPINPNPPALPQPGEQGPYIT